jgi:orotate phosphoribosyltransferase
MTEKEEKRAILFGMMKDYVYRYSEEEFTLASGRKSHHYFNCKELSLHPDRLLLLGDYLANYFLPDELGSIPEAVGGLTLGADPISYAIALEYAKVGERVFPLVVRKEVKDHGTKKEIEGVMGQIKTCVVIDDVITTGGSTLKAVEAIRRAGIDVQTGVCILDREEGGHQMLMENGVKMHALFKKSEFFNGKQPQN